VSSDIYIVDSKFTVFLVLSQRNSKLFFLTFIVESEVLVKFLFWRM